MSGRQSNLADIATSGCDDDVMSRETHANCWKEASRMTAQFG